MLLISSYFRWLVSFRTWLRAAPGGFPCRSPDLALRRRQAWSKLACRLLSLNSATSDPLHPTSTASHMRQSEWTSQPFNTEIYFSLFAMWPPFHHLDAHFWFWLSSAEERICSLSLPKYLLGPIMNALCILKILDIFLMSQVISDLKCSGPMSPVRRVMDCRGLLERPSVLKPSNGKQFHNSVPSSPELRPRKLITAFDEDIRSSIPRCSQGSCPVFEKCSGS